MSEILEENITQHIPFALKANAVRMLLNSTNLSFVLM